jgi:hypothetical protein
MITHDKIPVLTLKDCISRLQFGRQLPAYSTTKTAGNCVNNAKLPNTSNKLQLDEREAWLSAAKFLTL